MDSKSMSCEEIRAIIENLSSKKVDQAAQKQLKGHLDECTQCRLFYEKTLALNRLLDQWEMATPANNLQAKIMAKVAQVERERARRAQQLDFLGQLKSLLGYRFAMPAFAAALLIMFLLGSIAINIALVSRSQGPAGIAQNVSRGAPEGTPIAESVGNIVEPSPGPRMLIKQGVVYPSGRDLFTDFQWAAMAYQQPLIVIIGVPPLLPGQPVSSPQKIHTIQNIKKEEML
jgi:hypothetical protein